MVAFDRSFPLEDDEEDIDQEEEPSPNHVVVDEELEKVRGEGFTLHDVVLGIKHTLPIFAFQERYDHMYLGDYASHRRHRGRRGWDDESFTQVGGWRGAVNWFRQSP